MGPRFLIILHVVKELSTYIQLLVIFICIVGWNSNNFGSNDYPSIMCITFPVYISAVSLFQVYISAVYLFCPLICPRKVIHVIKIYYTKLPGNMYLTDNNYVSVSHHHYNND